MLKKFTEDKYIMLAVAVLIAVVVVLGIIFLPLGEQTRFVVRVKDSLIKETLVPSAEYKQEFKAPVKSVRGLTFYFDKIAKIAGVELQILDEGGKIMASSRNAKITYTEVRTDASFRFRKVDLEKDTKYFIRLANHGTKPVNLWSRDVNGENLIAFSILSPAKIDFRSSAGALTGVIFLLGLAVVKFINEKYRLVGTIILLAVITPLALGGFWKMDKFGISDWDYYMSTHSAYRQAILTNHVFPFWEPYTAGGTAGLADPEFPVLSPLFIPELIFGVPIGIRVAVMLSVLVGGLGVLALSRSVKLSLEACTLTAIGYMFGSVNLLEIVEGHTNIYMAMWIPWIFWAWLMMIRGNKKPIICGIFLALTFYGGGIYLLMYTVVAFIGLGLFTKKPLRTFGLTVKAGLWALGLSALKLIPVFLWLKNYPDAMYASSVNTLPWLKQIFLERISHGAQAIFNQGGGWHEYGAYLGYFLLVLALLGLLRLRTQKFVRLLSIAAVVAVLISASGPLFKPFFDIFPFIPRSNISRFVLFAVIPLVLLAGFGVDLIREKIKLGNILALIIIGCVAVDLMSFSYLLSTQAFVLDPIVISTKSAYPIEFTADNYSTTTVDVNGNDVKYSRSYAAFLAGYGSTTFPSVLGPDARVKTIQDEKHPYLELENGWGEAKLLKWSPNSVIVAVDVKESDNLIINTNFAPGWYANGMPAKDITGRVSTRISSGQSEVRFEYIPPGFFTGVLITLFTLGLVGYFRIRKKK
ncbi:MAG: hypothetical protein Q7S57_02450 [bacterium]|nr:hypothetical protein [bacterium]